MPQTLGAEIHLRRAHDLMQQVDKQTESFRQKAAAFSSAGDDSSSFLGSMAAIAKSSMRLKKEKASLVSDLQLAESEIDLADQVDSGATIETSDGVFGVPHLRAMYYYLMGTMEMIWGKPRDAEPIFQKSLDFVDFADTHYMLGLLYEEMFKPGEALLHFEKCLEAEPTGKLSTAALREANAMRNYKKRFRGNWLLLLILFFFPIPLVGAVVYFMMKWK